MISMDSGLGSDEEQRRSRTKEQKQRHNEQLLNGAHCFIDASSLQDEDTVTSTSDIEQRRTEERRQGALLFQSSIPQYSTMLQLAGPSDNPPDTPFNSIVNIEPATYDQEDNSGDVASKPSLGFFVDLSDVNVESSENDTATSTTKNIFSMVIDFEAPKKDMPSRLLRNVGRKKLSVNKEEVNGTASCLENCREMECVVSTVEENNVIEPECYSNEVLSHSEGGNECAEECSNTTESSDSTTDTKFVRLSDLMNQSCRPEVEPCSDYVGPRMSRSIPESSWVESPLMMSRSAGFRIAPRPLEPDNTSLSDSTGSQTGVSQRRLGTDLLRMFLEELDTDTVLHVGNPPRVIKAHRCILISRCQYFAGTLRGRSLAIEGFSYDAVHFALCHIYSGAAHVPDSISLVELASLADMLSLEGLKEVVAHALKSRHCHHFHSPCAGCLTGVLEVLPLAAAYGLDELYQRCLRWVTVHYLRVWPSRAFASLPKELREKCYQQHIVHMSVANVLEINLSCDRLLVALPSLKWAEPVVQLGLQLAHACQTYVTQHYATVLPTLLDMEPWNYPRIEEVLLNAADGLNLDQECCSYARCCYMLDKNKDDISQPLHELLVKVKGHFEKRILSKSHKLNKCPGWAKMESNLRLRIKNLGKSEDFVSKSYRNEPSRLPRMVPNKTNTSSSESSRNSSPATSQAHASPSLRRSLLLAARAPQVPPSPSTTRRISTLTLPTQASAAKSAPAKHIKQPMSTSLTNTSTRNRPSSAPIIKKTVVNKQVSVARPSSGVSRINFQRKEVSSVKKETVSKPQPAVTQVKRATKARSQVAAEKGVSNNKGNSTKQKIPSSDKSQKSPGMQRSSTFLKDEPTVLLTHPSQAQL